MITVKHINTIEELMPLFLEEKYQADIKRYRSNFVYRGISNTDYKMTTSLRRNCKDKSRQLEPSILKNYSKYASLDDPNVTNSVWRLMMSGQHHGLPTRLLDFTHSPLIALHFATIADIETMDSHDCVLWQIDMSEIHGALPEKYIEPIKQSQSKTYSLDTLEKVASSVEEYDKDMGDHNMIIIEPNSIDNRIVTQYSFFGIVPSDMNDIEAFLDKTTNNTVKYIISKDLRWRIADTLDAFNISERVIYPGLDGLSAWIARHYYARD